jgi:hypothetical protein
MNEEDELKNLFSMCYDMSVIKETQVFKQLRYYLSILELKNWQ